MKSFISRSTRAAAAAIALSLAATTYSAVAADARYREGASSCPAAGGANDGGGSSCRGETPTPPDGGSGERRRDSPRPLSVTFRNDSPYRADIHYDDGWFGKVVGTADAKGGELRMFTFLNHRHFVTLHGVREGLVDPASDEQYSFTARDRGDNIFFLPETAAPSKTKCKDRYPACEKEARRGECTRNPGWMIVNCCASCDKKEGFGNLIDPGVRCDPKRLNSTIPAWRSGSLNDLFVKWATEEEYQRYLPRVVSSPGKAQGAEYEGPWVMTFDNFIDDFEVEQLLEGASFGGFERSTDKGRAVGGSGEVAKVTSTHRTSSNAWCRSECESLLGVQRVTRRIEDVTGVTQNNYESFQILEYKKGQFYKKHHDSSQTKKDTAAGHRILTFFLYLNDVEEGGETRFTNLDISIAPKKGRALVWPSVLNEDPDSSDPRMYHEAKEVIRGTKYAANHWIHQYDFKNANLWGCNGSFA